MCIFFYGSIVLMGVLNAEMPLWNKLHCTLRASQGPSHGKRIKLTFVIYYPFTDNKHVCACIWESRFTCVTKRPIRILHCFHWSFLSFVWVRRFGATLQNQAAARIPLPQVCGLFAHIDAFIYSNTKSKINYYVVKFHALEIMWYLYKHR